MELYKKVCLCCGKSFEHKLLRVNYCSKACAVKDRPRTTKSNEVRFWEKVKKGGPDECWEFQGFLTRDGYGSIRVLHPETGKSYNDRSNRIAYYLGTGVWPGDKFVCHSCDNRKCCNPAHLWLGTNSDNMRDMLSKGRGNRKKGDENKVAKLNSAIVREIKLFHSAGWTYSKLADRFDVSIATIHRAMHSETWQHIA